MVYESECKYASVYAAFLQGGRYMIKKSQLLLIDVKILHHIFINLPSPPRQNNTEGDGNDEARVNTMQKAIVNQRRQQQHQQQQQEEDHHRDQTSHSLYSKRKNLIKR